jgi:hypothetical protein
MPAQKIVMQTENWGKPGSKRIRMNSGYAYPASPPVKSRGWSFVKNDISPGAISTVK